MKSGFYPRHLRLLTRYFCRLQDVGDHRIRRDAIQLGFRAQGQTMSEHGQRYVAHIIGRHKLTSANRRQRFRTQQQPHRSPGTRPVVNERMRTRAAHKIDSVVLNTGLHSRPRDLRAAMNNCGRILERSDINLLQPLRIEPVVPAPDNFTLVLFTGVAQQYLELEAIELCFRQWLSAFVFDRVLGGQHGED